MTILLIKCRGYSARIVRSIRTFSGISGKVLFILTEIAAGKYWVYVRKKKQKYPKNSKNKLEKREIGYILSEDTSYAQNEKNFGHRKQVGRKMPKPWQYNIARKVNYEYRDKSSSYGNNC